MVKHATLHPAWAIENIKFHAVDFTQPNRKFVINFSPIIQVNLSEHHLPVMESSPKLSLSVSLDASVALLNYPPEFPLNGTTISLGDFAFTA